MPRELKQSKQNRQSRESMRKNYYEKGGRAKCLLKYYKKLYTNDEGAQQIFNDEETSNMEKYKKIKMYHLEKRMNDFQ